MQRIHRHAHVWICGCLALAFPFFPAALILARLSTGAAEPAMRSPTAFNGSIQETTVRTAQFPLHARLYAQPGARQLVLEVPPEVSLADVVVLYQRGQNSIPLGRLEGPRVRLPLPPAPEIQFESERFILFDVVERRALSDFGFAYSPLAPDGGQRP